VFWGTVTKTIVPASVAVVPLAIGVMLAAIAVQATGPGGADVTLTGPAMTGPAMTGPAVIGPAIIGVPTSVIGVPIGVGVEPMMGTGVRTGRLQLVAVTTWPYPTPAVIAARNI
jgi:hypothetical protein